MQKSSQDTFEYEDLAALYRVEKKAPSLSAVRRDLYPGMAKLLRELNAEYTKQISLDPDSLICEGINQRRKKAKQLAKEVIELRMQKICSLALRGAMGAQNIIEPLTAEEKEYYNEVLNTSKRHASILTHLSGERKYESVRIDEVPTPKAEVAKEVPKPVPAAVVKPPEIEIEFKPEPEAESPLDDVPFDDVPETEFVGDADLIHDEDLAKEDEVFRATEPVRRAAKPVAKPAAIYEAKPDDRIMIRILEDLPEFSGPDRDYRLSKEDVVMMPKVMADALVNRGKAVCLHPTA